MPRYVIPHEALELYISLTTQLIKSGSLKSMKQVRLRFARKQFSEITGITVDRLLGLEKDWSKATVAEKVVLAHSLRITGEELEELI